MPAGWVETIDNLMKALSPKQRRKHRRYKVDSVDAALRVAWLDLRGNVRMDEVRVIDVCERGLGLELPEPAKPNSAVWLQSDQHGLSDPAVVRYCRKSGSQYVAGIEFTGELCWTPPEELPQEPISLGSAGNVPLAAARTEI